VAQPAGGIALVYDILTVGGFGLYVIGLLRKATGCCASSMAALTIGRALSALIVLTVGRAMAIHEVQFSQFLDRSEEVNLAAVNVA
jgi:hypothetical protein